MRLGQVVEAVVVLAALAALAALVVPVVRLVVVAQTRIWTMAIWVSYHQILIAGVSASARRMVGFVSLLMKRNAKRRREALSATLRIIQHHLLIVKTVMIAAHWGIVMQSSAGVSPMMSIDVRPSLVHRYVTTESMRYP